VTRHIRLAGALLLFLGCASGPRAPAAAGPRIKDSAPEKVAAQRSAARGLQLEGEDQRWGIEGARARRRAADEKKRQQEAAAPATGPVDLAKPPAGAPR
jgi:hypothetical protein